MKFFRIKSSYSLKRLETLLEEYELYDINGEDNFLLLGYQTLSPQAKETYRVLRGIYELSRKSRQKTKKEQIDVSLEYLAVIFNTSREAQSARIQQLIKHGLVQVKKTSSNFNSYHILHPVPDSTFVHTVVQLIRRKRLGQLGYKYKSTSSVTERIEILQEIHKLQRKGAVHFQATSITGITEM